jgi:2-polyprenyl-3-methyl-5-hydroxy-6-metoxy-1,4-benzoquinol methylase
MGQGDLRARLYASYRSTRGLGCFAPSASFFFDHVVTRHFPKDRSARVLDLGTGQGLLLRAARAAGYLAVTGVDTSQEQVAAGLALGIEGIVHGDLLKALEERQEHCLEVVTALDIIEHLSREEFLHLADEVHRVLVPGARWIIHTVNAASPFFGRILYGDFTHEHAYTASSLTQALRVSGFDAVECFEDRPLIHGIPSLIRRGFWFLIRSALWIYLAAETGTTEAGIFSQNLTAVAYKGLQPPSSLASR